MSQFKALSRKNWILWKRGLCGNITEIIIPIIFIAFIVVIRKLVTVDTYTEQSFLSNPFYTKSIYGDDGGVATRNLQLKTCPTGTIVALVPSGNSLVTTLNAKLTARGYSVQQFASDSDVNDRVRSLDYKVGLPGFCFGISVVQSTAGSAYKYKLRFNQSTNIANTEGPGTIRSLQQDQSVDLALYMKTLGSGMIGTTTFVNNFILQAETGSTSDVLKNTIGPIYQQAYERDSIYTSAKNNVAILFLLPLLIIYLRQTSTMLSEKQKKIRQTMSIMGMNIPLYYFTWFIRYVIVFLIVHIIGSIIIARTLPHVPFYIPFVIFILFDILLIVQSFFIQTFFSRSKIGVVIALLFFLVQYILSFISSNSDNPTLGINRAISIVPHVAFILAFQTMLYGESVKIKLSFSEQINNYSVGTAVLSFVINIGFWLVLTWYLEQVFPNQFGSKKHPLFCCFDKKNQIKDQDETAKSQLALTDIKKKYKPQIEEVDQKFKVQENQKRVIDIQLLRKQFNGDFVAVNDLSVKMYQDNIFVLLGHNGAGKTTTISMLTGMLEPSSGKIQVLGETNMTKIRQKIGICPQHDTLYDDLTVEQHLELFGTFRGLNSDQLEQQVKKLINDVNLLEKSNQYSKNLSGGQKRRLSVAMAFAGRSKVIILDEPTSGMDTSARRYIWQLLKSYKSDRIILLTTHFMDQADYLGDRIGIMAGGRLICCGSGHYLKNKFGVGYNITFVKKNSQTSSDQIMKIVKKHIPRANLLSDISAQITMQLPMDEVKKFPQLFNEIDSKKDTLSISTYGISITTLEEVFLKVGEQTEKIEQMQKNQGGEGTPAITRKVQNTNKQYEKISDKSPMKSNDLDHRETQANFHKELKIQRLQGSALRFFLHLWATILKRLRVIKRDYKSFILELLLPMVIIIFALLLMRISFIKDLPERELNLQNYKSKASPLVVPIGSSDATILSGIQSKLTAVHGSGVSVVKDTTSATALLFDSSFLKPKKISESFLMGGIFFKPQATENSQSIYQVTTVVNTRIPTSYLYLQTLAAQAYLNQVASKSVSITLVQYPFPRTYNQLQINNTISGFFGSLIFSIALAFKFASIIAFIVKQRQDKSKHQQIVSGMNIYAYWFGNFIYDYILYTILAAFSIIMCTALDAKAFLGQNYGATIATFFLYGLAYIPMTYMLAYLFKDYGSAQAGYYFFTFIVGGLLPIIMLLLRFLGGSTNKVALVLSWILRFIPAFSFGQTLINIGSINLLAIVELGSGNKYNVWDQKIALAPTIFLAVQFVCYTIFVFVLEAILNNQNIMRFLTSQAKIQDTEQVIDSDVLQMRQKALKANPQDYEILTKNLRKVYMLDSDKKYKVAVDNLSLGIQKGQVFGLLGVNGAGKTTTFKILAGEITSTSGDSYFTGLKISDNLKRIRQNLGYCPQFDALIENLTVREQIQLFYDLKSLPKEHKEQLVSEKIRQMNLENYQDKLSGTLSGGNKRKLSVAMAMIGNPSIIFLDEPSTGMDPKARRFMWKIISRIASEKKQSTIILTTHSMQQAQALSTKLGIMVSGQFKCYGTPQHIKSKYGDGYEFQIKLNPCSKQEIKKFMLDSKLQSKDYIQDKELEGFFSYLKIGNEVSKQISKTGSGNYLFNLIQTNKKIETFQVIEFILLLRKINKIKGWMTQKFGESEVIENFQTFIRFKVKATMSVGKMFQILETQKDLIEIESYSIKQATVQQIFNRFAQTGQLSEMMG